MHNSSLDQAAITTLRVHSIEMVEIAKSGHPGMALGAAPIIWTIYKEGMKHNPQNPQWINRDRFVLSAGHSSPLLYSLLNLFGYDLSAEDMASFRQLHSKTPGHPEVVVTPGVDAGTGPLGQGVAMGVGMALAEAHLAAKFNRPGFPVMDHYTFVLHGDGCPQEGVAMEAASFAGGQKLGKLINIYDRNQITIDGSIDLTFNDDIGKRYEAMGWQVLHVEDANDLSALSSAIAEAKAEENKPSLIIVNSTIGYGSPLQGSNKTHGAPLGPENVKATKEHFNWPLDRPDFYTDPELEAYMAEYKQELAGQEAAWHKLFQTWADQYPDLAQEWESYFNSDYSGLDRDPFLAEIPAKAEASRESSHRILNHLAENYGNLLGGSADLAGSNKTWLDNQGTFGPEDRLGRNIHYGIREFAMSCIMNGILLHGGLRAFCSTFFTFSDYMRSGIRSAGLMNLPAIFVLTHDSVGVGEDGPTHQPVEHLTSFRAMPKVLTFRPCDFVETAAAYRYALQSGRPTIMALSRQGLDQLDLPASDRAVEKGAYVVKDTANPQLLFIATGSEVSLALQAQEKLAASGIGSRVVSMPCMKLFLEQDPAYQEEVLPASLNKRLALEAGSSLSWYRFVGPQGKVIGIDDFGLSAKANDVFKYFGFTVENVVAEAKELLD